MKNVRLVVWIYLLLSGSLLLAQAGPGGAQKRSSGSAQPGTMKPSYYACDGSTPTIMADGAAHQDYVAAATWAVYQLHLLAGHSYVFEASNPYGQDFTYANGRPRFWMGYGSGCPNAGNWTDVSGVDPELNSGFSGRIAFIQPSEELGWVALLNNDGSNGYYFNVRIVDTTLYSPRWSTWSGFLTQWGLSNVTNHDISGVLTVFDTTGTAIKTVNVTVPAGKVKLYSSVPTDLNLPINTSGNVTFAYIGPAGGIQADAAILNSSDTVVFGAKFEPRNYQH